VIGHGGVSNARRNLALGCKAGSTAGNGQRMQSAPAAPVITLSSAVYLAGDTVTATITFPQHGDHVLEWAGVQLHGHVWHDPRLVSGFPRPALEWRSTTPPHRRSPRSSSLGSAKSLQTAMADFVNSVPGAQCLFATRPLVVAAALELSSAPQTFTFSAQLPRMLPPTFRGLAARYWYLLTVCIKDMHGATPRVAHVPIAVGGTPDSKGDAARRGPCVPLSSRVFPVAVDDESVAVHINFFPALEAGSFLYFPAHETSFKGEANVDGDAVLSEPPQEQQFATLNATAVGSGERVARVVVCPSVLVPGEAFVVKLDLARRCKSVALSLEQEECAMCPPPLHAAFEPLMRRRHGAGPWHKELVKITRDTSLCTSLCVALPSVHVTPDFSTDLVAVRTLLVLAFDVVDGDLMVLRYPVAVRPHAAEPMLARFTPSLHRQDSMELSAVKIATPPPTPKQLVF